MAADSVPWFTGGGAEHSPEIARTLVYALGGGDEGVVSPGDLKVLPLATAGASVRAVTGAGIVLSRASGGSQQAYVARFPTETVVGIAPTTSAGGRTDLIVLQVEDPFMAGEPWADPADPKVGPYVFIRVLSNTSTVPAGRSAIPLARVTLPASTSVVTASHITDLRRLAQPKSKHEVKMGGPTVEVNLVASTGAIWPDFRPNVEVPAWATHVQIVTSLSSVGLRDGSVNGVLATTIGTAGNSQFRSANLPYDLDVARNDGARHTFVIGGAGAIPTALRGTMQPLGVEGSRLASVNNGRLVTVTGTQVVYDVNFTQEIV